jgi:hypothetical protein
MHYHLVGSAGSTKDPKVVEQPNDAAVVPKSNRDGLPAVFEVDSGFDGMLPDPILERDLIDRMENEDSA